MVPSTIRALPMFESLYVPYPTMNGGSYVRNKKDFSILRTLLSKPFRDGVATSCASAAQRLRFDLIEDIKVVSDGAIGIITGETKDSRVTKYLENNPLIDNLVIARQVACQLGADNEMPLPTILFEEAIKSVDKLQGPMTQYFAKYDVFRQREGIATLFIEEPLRGSELIGWSEPQCLDRCNCC